ncbi:DASH family cryptochrome [Mucilaginibacter sp. McL0603]|uniref:DASH family cryptochrome n=1 Tax=Mucilaginibacter sp. McL0603 TaxID=3415670 RepID=UPI003CEB6F0A
MSEKTILVWFRNDLRVHDNEILFEATRKADKVLPVYIFDPFYFKTTELGLLKTGNIRARFLLESVADLRHNLQSLGGELIVKTGNPAEIIPLLAQQYQVSEVYHHREVAFEETRISEDVEAALWKIKLNLKHFIGHTLYHKEDLPFPIKDIPDSFAVFKKKVERDSEVRPCIETPDHINIPEITDAGNIPTLVELGLTEVVDDQRADFHYQGGEATGLQQLTQYILNSGQTTTKGPRYASRLSAWISLGCLSMRWVYREVTQGSHNSNSPLVLELLWRDYFRFMFKKHGKQFFSSEEITDVTSAQDELFEQWKSGTTGVPYIDASMHQLNATGYMDNYNRQIVAGFLINELKVNWTKGAAYFEEKLIDYSPASNMGNWAFVAGINNDPRDSRYFVGTKQVAELDTQSQFISTWQPIFEDGDSLSPVVPI